METVLPAAPCSKCQGLGYLGAASAFGFPAKCFKCSGTGKIQMHHLHVGDHACYLYEDPEKQLAIAASFLAEGLKKNQRCVYVADEHRPEEILSVLSAAGIRTKEESDKGNLSIITKHETYLADGTFVPEKMVDRLRQISKSASQQGGRPVRSAAEMSWASKEVERHNALVNYELLVDFFFLNVEPKMLGLCQYNVKHFHSAIIDGMRLSHRLVFQD